MDKIVSWPEFIVVSSIGIGIIIVFYGMTKWAQIRYPNLKRILNSPKLAALERIVITLFFIFLVCLFISIDIYKHGLLIFIIVIFGFKFWYNMVLGSYLLFELSISRGSNISWHDQVGVVDRLGWTGLHVIQGRFHSFLPYEFIYKYGLSTEIDTKSKLLKLICQGKENTELNRLLPKIQEAVFNFPYISGDQTPTFRLENNNLHVTLKINNKKFAESLISKLTQLGLEIEVASK